MLYQPQVWLPGDQQLRGVLHGARRLIADGTWIPTTPDNAVETLQATHELARWLEAKQPRRLPRPVGIVHEDEGIILVAYRYGGRPLSQLSSVSPSAALAITAVLLYVVDTWFGDSEQIPLSPEALDTHSIRFRHDAQLAVTRLLPTEQGCTRAQANQAIAAVLASLLTVECKDDTHRGTAQRVVEVLGGPGDAEGRHKQASAIIFDQKLHRDTLADLAFKLATELGPRGGTHHPWSNHLWRVQHWDAFEVPDITKQQGVGRPVEAKYTVQTDIAKGGMGRIYGAWDPWLQREVALKVLYEDGLDDKPFVSRFLREIRITAQLDHPAIIPVYTLERTESGAPAFTMKHVRGQNFHEYLRGCVSQLRQGRLDSAHSLTGRLNRFLTVCDAVAYAHSKGVLHRDLKLENMMVGPFNEVYVMDWGVARVFAPDTPELPDDEISEVTHLGDVVGTESYMSPEQALGRHDLLTPASDQFSLGLVLFELAALLRARPSGTPEEMLQMARGGWEDEMLDLDGHELPRPLQAIIERATRHDPMQRYPDVASFAEDIRRFLDNRELLTAPDDLPMRIWRSLSHKPTYTLGLLIALVSVASVLTTASLVKALDAQRQATTQVARAAKVVATVTQASRELDRELQRHLSLLEGLTSHIATLLDEPADRGPMYRMPHELSLEQPDVYRSDRRRQLVTFEEPVAYLAPEASERSNALAATLHPIGRAFRELTLRSHDVEALRWERDAQDAALRRDDRPLLWTLAGFESGLFLTYPGHDKLPEDYDPRVRPWYLAATDASGPQWGRPYVDSAGTGLLLAASAPIRSATGKLLGVAGVELSLSDVIQTMRDMDTPGLRGTYILDDGGRVVIDAAGKDATPISEPRLFSVLPVVNAVRSGASQGLQRDGKHLYVYDRMDSLNWTFVAHFSPNELIQP